MASFGFGVLQGEGINEGKDGMKLEQFVSLVGSEREIRQCWKTLKSQRFRQIWEDKTTATYVQLSEFGE